MCRAKITNLNGRKQRRGEGRSEMRNTWECAERIINTNIMSCWFC